MFDFNQTRSTRDFLTKNPQLIAFYPFNITLNNSNLLNIYERLKPKKKKIKELLKALHVPPELPDHIWCL